MLFAVITEYLAREGDPLYGGVDSRVVHLCQKLAERNEVHVFASNQGGEGIEQYGDIVVHRVGKSRPFTQRGHFLSRLEFSKACARAVTKLNPDVIEASGFVSYPAGIHSKAMSDKPTMVTVHEVWQGEWLRNMGTINGALGSVLERRNLLKPFDRYIAVSEFTKGKLIDNLGISQDKVCVIPNGVDRSVFDSVEVNEKFDSPSVVTVCRLVSYKKVDLLVQAVARLREKYADIKLLIVGKGPEEDNLRQLVKNLGMGGNVEFLGKVSDTRDLVRTLKRSHAFALPSITEGFGIVVIEAVAAGIPYVASDIPSIREATKGGVGGMLFKPLDAEELAHELDETLEGRAAEGGTDTSKLLEGYDWKNLAMTYESEARRMVDTMDQPPEPCSDCEPHHVGVGPDNSMGRRPF